MPVMAEALPGRFRPRRAVDDGERRPSARIAAGDRCATSSRRSAQVRQKSSAARRRDLPRARRAHSGGPKMDNEDAVDRASPAASWRPAARGVAIGRNCWGSDDPAKLVSATRRRPFIVISDGHTGDPRLADHVVGAIRAVRAGDRRRRVGGRGNSSRSSTPDRRAGRRRGVRRRTPSWTRRCGAARESFDDGRWRRMPARVEPRSWSGRRPRSAQRVAELIGLDCVCTGKVFLGGIQYDGYEAVNAWISAAAEIREESGRCARRTSRPACSRATGRDILSLRLTAAGGRGGGVAAVERAALHRQRARRCGTRRRLFDRCQAVRGSRRPASSSSPASCVKRDFPTACSTSCSAVARRSATA